MLLQLLLTGTAFALLPLFAVWRAKQGTKTRKLALVMVILTVELIMFGAFTRLTDSGLGCPDWPGCYGKASPFGAHAEIKEAEIQMPTGPVTLKKAWIEMVHRYLAMSLGFLIVVNLCIALSKKARENQSPLLAGFLFFLVCLQGAFGAWTVTLKLQPIIVTIHLMLAMILLAFLSMNLSLYTIKDTVAPVNHSSLRRHGMIALLLLFVQIFLGGWVSTNYSAMACGGYPLCNGEIIPRFDWYEAFHLWRELGESKDGGYIPFPALATIQFVHRHFALIVVAALAWLGWRLRKQSAYTKEGNYLLGAIALQFVLGVATVSLNWPLLIAVLHNGGAALLVVILSMLNYRLGRKPSVG